MQTSPGLFLIVGGSIWLGATIFVAAISMYCPDIFLHGNPIGMRCVLGCTGAIVGIPVGCFGHQMYSVFKTKISADLVLNTWLGIMIPILCSNLVLCLCNILQQVIFVLPEHYGKLFGVVHISILVWLIFILAKDQDQIIKTCSPSFHHTMCMVKEVLTPATRRILDLRFVIRHQMMPLAYTGFLEGTWILPMAIIDQLRIWSLHQSSRIQYRAQRTLASLNCFQKSYGNKLVISLRNYPQQWGAIRSLLGESVRSDSRLLLTNYHIIRTHKNHLLERSMKQQRLESNLILPLVDLCTNRGSVSCEGLLCLPTWAQALQSPYQPGDWLELPIIGTGRLPNQGKSHLEDGSLVFISKGADYIGYTVRVQVVHVLHSVTGFVIFANLSSNHLINRQR